MGSKGVVLGSWLAVAGMTTVQWVTDPSKSGFPPPGRYLASGVLFTLLYGAAGFTGTLAATIAVGTALGIFMSPYLKGSNVGLAQKTGNWLSQVSGQPKIG